LGTILENRQPFFVPDRILIVHHNLEKAYFKIEKEVSEILLGREKAYNFYNIDHFGFNFHENSQIWAIQYRFL